jgi:hypothetical protein
MLLIIEQMNLDVQSRAASTCLVPNKYDCHVLVEMLDEATGQWVLSDPTFGLIAHNASDNSIATLAQMQAAARDEAWSLITYEYLTPTGIMFAYNYYLDYPLLFVNTYVSGQQPPTLTLPADPDTITKYYVPVGSLAPPGAYGAYALQCPNGATSTSAVVDGVSRNLDCDATFGVSQIVLATTIVPQDSAVVLKPRRFVFPAWQF